MSPISLKTGLLLNAQMKSGQSLYFPPGSGASVGGRLTRSQRESLDLQCKTAGDLTYVPNGDTTGLLPGWTPADLEPVAPAGTATYVTITGIRENQLIWAEIRPGTFGGPDLRNCATPGQRPQTIGSGSGLVKCYDTGIAAWKMTDCLLDVLLWTDASLNPPGGVVTLEDARFYGKGTIGIRGGRGTLLNCEIRNVQDGVHVNYRWISAADPGHLTILHSWIHSMLFYQGPLYPEQPEGTHSDAIQFHQGKHVTVLYCMLGGPSAGTGYSQVPAFNSGEGCKNAIIMLQQEVSNEYSRLIEFVEIAYCIMWNEAPNGYNVNHPYKIATSGGTPLVNEMDTVSLHHLKFVYRSDGKYVILNKTHYEKCYSNNDIVTMASDRKSWTVVGPVTYTTGA